MAENRISNQFARPSTPDFNDQLHQRPNPFSTPNHSNRGSTAASTTALHQIPQPKYFHSRRVKRGTVERPWLDKKDPKDKWITIIPLIGIFAGLGIAGLLVWDGLRSVVNHVYCPVLEEDFSRGINDKVWFKEVEVGGFGNGQFEMTTAEEENVYIQDGMLYIKPTLQNQELIETNNVINLLKDKSCTSQLFENCVTSTNTTNGTIVNPVKSARLSTRFGPSIKFGRIEVVAKLPAGDWLWPAIWMLPTENKYGGWPRSGEIDIVESRGNNHTYENGGNNIASSTLHWGPDEALDAWWRNNVKRKALHTTYSDGFHTFGVEWSEDYIFTYVDTRLLQVMYTRFDKPFFKIGKFPLTDRNGTRIEDPWRFTGRPSTPFDENFYLILNVAVGGTNGWFEDGAANKPWVDSSPTARKDFWNAREQWYPTWEEKGHMVVKRVSMWQQQGYNGC